MEYIYQPGEIHGKHLLLLHGTGGDETSLLQIAQFLDENCTILSFRGEIKEDGMNRFFKRDGLNQFNIASLEEETDKLLAEITEISQEKKIPLEDWILVGYSNGANIAAHLLLERKTPLKKGVFFHPMSLGQHTQSFSLKDKEVWLSKGANDPIVSSASFEELTAAFKSRKGKVTIFTHEQGHQLNMEELTAARNWIVTQD